MRHGLKITSSLLTLVLILSSCKTVEYMGTLNMVSSRNIDTKMGDYSLIKNYAGGSASEIKKALKKTKASTLEAAVDETVRNVAGGEFLKNVKLYSVKRSKQSFFFVEGDVWGFKNVETFRGFKIGDTVQWIEKTKAKKGIITGLIDSEFCMVKEDGDDLSRQIKFSNIVKVSE
jgi:hypothetical protein